MIKINPLAIGIIAAFETADEAIECLKKWLPEPRRADCYLTPIEKIEWASARRIERKDWIESAYARANA